MSQPGTLEAAFAGVLVDHLGVIARRCTCGEVIEPVHGGRRADALDEPHRAHVAAVLADTVREWETGRVEAVRALAEKWRYKGEFGWGAWQEGHGPDLEGQILDDCASELRAALHDPKPGEPR